MHPIFEQIRDITLHGTNRLGTHPELPEWVPSISSEDTTTQLLHTLALLSTAQKAGQRILPSADLPQPMLIEESLPYCNTTAVQLWHDIVELESKYPVFEQRWLQLCAQLNQVIAPEIITSVLALGATKKMAHLRPYIAQVIGKRGLWIAAQYTKWHYALTPDYHQIWQEGKPAERLDILRRLRIENPEIGRKLVEKTWDKESAADRKKMIEVFKVGITPDDETFFATKLDDLAQKSPSGKAVVQETKRLLVQYLLTIENSALRQQWISLLSKYFMNGAVHLPDTDDDCFHPAWLVFQNGFPPKKDIADWWLEILTIMPPAVWPLASGLPLELSLAAIQNSKYGPSIQKINIQDALINATLYYSDPDWAAILLQIGTNLQFVDLLSHCSAAHREAIMMDAKMSPAVLNLVWSSPAIQFNWSLKFSEWVLRELFQSWMGYYFSKVQQIMPLDVFLHPQTRPAELPTLYDSPEKRDKWLQVIAPELEKALVVKRIFGHYAD